jgi:predicted nucleic acid-binding protein
MILLDTNVLSELMGPKPDSKVKNWVDRLNRFETGITSITLSEILYGIGLLPHGARKRTLLDAATYMFDDLFLNQIYSFDQFAAVEYARIVVNREKSGIPISIPDAQIAAICLVQKAQLATRNTKDFIHLGLELVNPWVA